MYFVIFLVLALAAAITLSLPSHKDRREDGIARRARGELKSNPTVAGSFLNPALSVPAGDEDQVIACTLVAAVDIDWMGCQTGGILDGFQSFIFDGSRRHPHLDFSVSVGDNLNITISVTAMNVTSGTVVITNQSTNQTVSRVVTSGPLCMMEADWLIVDLEEGFQIPFPDFGCLNFYWSGKTSIREVLFGALPPKQAFYLEMTTRVQRHTYE
ncbi:uncharacterized protein PHACADRAFT_202441 [Phanerochaete carnosa HHB-10118-sp]|uniref:Uncharacterized protein n=1 Tax=Phanerochaete carnosa (strain HHB-10118-sp) TaxID=650164 RepID=K5VPW0_PHACS|nr:uncharacterized protein PHACADRAFT_202441 [Phanerochaete carnosa HHB-10118-sp]EKM48755.1 hypothetical protein PHACADRAFT_202441 [Phanerochaete carnosa HHB-10118-sp]